MILTKCKSIEELVLTKELLIDLMRILPLEFEDLNDYTLPLVEVLKDHGLIPTNAKELTKIIFAMKECDIVEVDVVGRVKLSELLINNFME